MRVLNINIRNLRFILLLIKFIKIYKLKIYKYIDFKIRNLKKITI